MVRCLCAPPCRLCASVVQSRAFRERDRGRDRWHPIPTICPLRSRDGIITEMDLVESISRAFEAAGHPDVVSVYLFGSHAEGRAHRESDVDIGVLFDHAARPTRKARFDRSLKLAADLPAASSSECIDVVVLNDAPPLFGRRIVTEGVRLYCSNSEADHAYVRDIQLRAADLQPFLERMRRIKLEALAPR